MAAHLLVVHFPIALLVLGAAADLVGWMTGRDSVRRIAGTLLILGAATAFLAFLTGQGAMDRVLARVHPGDPRLETHAQWRAAGSWLLLAAGTLRALWRDRLAPPHGIALLAAAVLSAAVVMAIGITGTEISHGH